MSWIGRTILAYEPGVKALAGLHRAHAAASEAGDQPRAQQIVAEIHATLDELGIRSLKQIGL